jgi:hypothetical protein
VAAPAAHAASYTISAKGGANSFGRVIAIGDFKPERNPTLGAAVAAFGTPSSTREESRGTSCHTGWRELGLRIVFVNLGSGGSACAASLGRAQSASAFGRRWRTSRGLKIGDSTRRLRRLYPHALRRGRTYRLVAAKSVFGDGGRYSVLAAKTRAGRVRSFRLFIGAAGE